MKLVFVAVAALLVVAAVAAPADQPPVAILRSEFDQKPEGGYLYNFETENKIARDEVGEVKSIPDEENKPHEVVVVRGSYSYTDPEGNPHKVEYYADETGFHAEGADIPKAA